MARRSLAFDLLIGAGEGPFRSRVAGDFRFTSAWSVRLRSSYYLRKREQFPGLPPGWGFDLDDYWGNQLVK